MRELDIQEVKVIELELLKIFHDFCEENNLRYSIAFGTLIGAIRHKGFIPWDDDIDVIMPRDDYEKLLTIFHNNSCELVNHRVTENYFYPFAKLIANDTLLVEPTVRKKFNKGIYIDIFPMDGVPVNKEERLRVYDNVWKKKRKLAKCIIGYKPSHNFGRTILKYASNTLYSFVNYKKITQEMEDLSREIPFGETPYYGNVVWGDTVKNAGKIAFFDDLIDLEFEGELFKGFASYDEVLSNIYGKYMEFPPQEERVLKHNFKAYKLNE